MTTCTACSEPVMARGLCRYHYDMTRRGRVQCSVEECHSYAKARGLCGRHYERWRTHGSVRVLRRQQSLGSRSAHIQAVLPVEDKAALTALAAEQGMSISHLVREAVRRYVTEL